MGEGAKGDAFFAGEWGIVVFFEEKMREGTTLRVDAKASVAAFGHIGK